MEGAAWLNDQRLAHMDKTKLEFLQKIIFDSKGIGQKEMLPYMLALATKFRNSGQNFNSEEIDLIVQVLKSHSTPEEAGRMNMLLALLPR